VECGVEGDVVVGPTACVASPSPQVPQTSSTAAAITKVRPVTAASFPWCS
jgi:hypothetical protein